MNKKKERVLTIMYSNIKGFTKKKESLVNIMEEIDCDLCLLVETMTCRAKINGCKSVTAKKSVGQNVCILLRNDVMNERIIKLYEPNDVANMIGIRMEIWNRGLRIFTAHLKQQSTNTREEIEKQFEEVRNQFIAGNSAGEGVMMICDANVHVGGEAIKGCKDKQDWGGKVLMKIIEEENLILMNADDMFTGCVTRVDPRNGRGSTIDLVVINQCIYDDILEVGVDEKGDYKPANYTAKSKKVTDHNTIITKIKVKRSPKQKSLPYFNTKCEAGRTRFLAKLGEHEEVLNDLFKDTQSNLTTEYQKMMDT